MAQQSVVNQINRTGTFDSWSVRVVEESGIIGGQKKCLYEFFGNSTDTIYSQKPLVRPKDCLWRTNNVLAVVAGVVKTNCTVFPEKRGSGYCARIETHIETVKALGINMEVVCQGGFLLGDLTEPIKSTRDPMSKVLYGIPFEGRPKALVYDFKAEVGHSTIRGTGFSRLKDMGTPDYPIVAIILQKRWEEADGSIHALRVGTGMELIRENVPEWKNAYRLEVKYGDITSSEGYEDYMGLNNNPETAFHAINSKGQNVQVVEDGWADPSEEPNFLIIKFLSSFGKPFHGGVGNILWLDNVRVEM